jgi:hypothetical protein
MLCLLLNKQFETFELLFYVNCHFFISYQFLLYSRLYFGRRTALSNIYVTRNLTIIQLFGYTSGNILKWSFTNGVTLDTLTIICLAHNLSFTFFEFGYC